MKKKINIGLIFGGRSGEHEVSLISARSIYNALDKKKYAVKLIGIDKEGSWHLGQPKDFWLKPESPKTVKLNLKYPIVTPVTKKKAIKLINIKNGKEMAGVDVFFPITHGTFGEDGCLQGMLEILGAAYVGPNVLGSAVGMDKDVMKRLFLQAGISTARYYKLLRSDNTTEKDIEKIIKGLKFPIFVKPANLGSSVGISKAENRKDLKKAIKEAFQYDTKIILEEMIRGREIECSVMGNENPVASVPGEIVLTKGFYSYDAKYVDEDTAVPNPKVDLPKETIKKVQSLAVEVFKTLNCEGMGRVDFFLLPSGKLFANEINTLPGFTSVSMYPKMFSNSGIPYPALLDKLIQFAIDRHKRNDKIKRNFA